MKCLQNAISFYINELCKFAMSMRGIGQLTSSKKSISRRQKRFFIKTLIIILTLLTSTSICWAESFITEASYYTRASCIKESGQAVMACGKELNDKDYTCAIWDYKFGTMFKVTNIKTGASVQVMVTDRGPAKWLIKKGRRLDLSPVAFKALDGGKLDRGLLQVLVTKIK